MGGGGLGGERRTGDSVIVPCFKHLAHLKGVGGVYYGGPKRRSQIRA